ncbi:PRTRC system ThiF family protein [Kistimonas scapharcae]|uniref:PRTRC system ThiF family protein n=1 Tax=Kistimonas scapharcae TaxID=1036133 RepID=A0ABP8V0R0_9GAMM
MATFTTPVSWLSGSLRIALIGVGGTGSEILDELVQMHYLLCKLGGEGFSVTAFDPDIVSPANVGRQRFLPNDVGYNKAEILITKYRSFLGVDWKARPVAFKAEHADHFDLIITAVDKAQCRADIGKHWQKKNSSTLWLDCGNSRNDGNVILGHLGTPPQTDSLRLPNVFDLYPVLAEMEDNDTDSCSHADAIAKQDYGVNKKASREAMSILWNLMRHGSIDYHGAFFDLCTGTTTPLKIDGLNWATFGYVA